MHKDALYHNTGYSTYCMYVCTVWALWLQWYNDCPLGGGITLSIQLWFSDSFILADFVFCTVIDVLYSIIFNNIRDHCEQPFLIVMIGQIPIY